MFWSTKKKPTKISKELAQKTLSGSKGYLSATAKKALSKAGISLNKSFTRKEVEKASKILQEVGEISELYTPTKIASGALKKQETQDELVKEARTKKFVASYIAEELAEERAELLGKVGGRKSPRLTLSEELEKEQENRQEKAREEMENREKLIAPLKGKLPIRREPSGGGEPPPDIMSGM